MQNVKISININDIKISRINKMNAWKNAKGTAKTGGPYLAFYGEAFIAKYISSIKLWKFREDLSSDRS